eukprot:COSAG06_NODE_3446_length_5331_cov_9.329702_3_plen_201_part_00
MPPPWTGIYGPSAQLSRCSTRRTRPCSDLRRGAFFRVHQPCTQCLSHVFPCPPPPARRGAPQRGHPHGADDTPPLVVPIPLRLPELRKTLPLPSAEGLIHKCKVIIPETYTTKSTWKRVVRNKATRDSNNQGRASAAMVATHVHAHHQQELWRPSRPTCRRGDRPAHDNRPAGGGARPRPAGSAQAPQVRGLLLGWRPLG